MRDLFFVIFVGALLPGIFLHPYTGVLMYVWFSLMRPHQLTWGFAQSIPTAFIIGVLTMISFFLDKKRSMQQSPIFILMICFMITLTLSAYFSLAPDYSWLKWNLTIKIVLFTSVIYLMLSTKLRIQALIWVCVVSIGYYSLQSGAYSINSLGEYKAIPDFDNNGLALMFIMALPLMVYLRRTTSNKLAQNILLASIGLTFFATITTYSRGGVIGLVAITIFLWLKSQRKMKSFLFFLILAALALSVMPEKFFLRMETVQEATKDSSFQGRLDAWTYAWNVALARPLIGGGISATEVPYVFQRYNPNSMVTDGGRAAHSIYFQVLGDQGFIGLFIFILMIVISWFNGSWLIKHTKSLPCYTWAHELSKMLQVGLIAYIVSGAGLSSAYYDLFYIYAIILARLRLMVQEAISPKKVFVSGHSPSSSSVS